MMGIRIECYATDMTGVEWVRVSNDVDFSHFCVPHAEFKAACCRDLGLVDFDMIKAYGFGASEDYVCNQSEDMRKAYESLRSNYEVVRIKLVGKRKAADVLAAASRRLA